MISVVINTFNEEKNLARAIKSVAWADEILVCDMYSRDKTVEIAKKLGAKVIFHKYIGFVEPARNFAISKATSDWILILDADEEISDELASKLQNNLQAEVVALNIPRKNTIFNKWIRSSMWWPDYNIRFFKKSSVKWSDKIHSKPEVLGAVSDLPAEENLAILHHHYSSINEYLEKLNRYTQIQAEELIQDGYQFKWQDLVAKPMGEFLSRFFANRGYQDGLHGLALSLLQALSFLITYLKVWEREKFKAEDIKLEEVEKVFKQEGAELRYWFNMSKLSKNPFLKIIQKLKRRVK